MIIKKCGVYLVQCNGNNFVPEQDLGEAYKNDPLTKELASFGGDYAAWLEVKLIRLINEMKLMIAFADEREHECEIVDHLKHLVG